MGQERILLCSVEAVDLVDEEQRSCSLIRALPGLGPRDNLPHFLHAAQLNRSIGTSATT